MCVLMGRNAFLAISISEFSNKSANHSNLPSMNANRWHFGSTFIYAARSGKHRCCIVGVWDLNKAPTICTV